MDTFNIDSYKEQTFTFPHISYEEFKKIDDMRVRREIVKRNRILMTDTYNRTMEHIKGEEKSKEIETYSLAFRKSPNGFYNIVHGVRSTIKELFEMPITQPELDFAKDFYKEQADLGGVSYFNEQPRQEIVDNGGKIPLTIKAVQDGTAMKIKEAFMTVTGESEIAARFEPMLLRIFYKSAVATGAHIIEEILGEGRVAEFGMRSGFNSESHFDAVESCVVGMGLKLTSDDMAACIYPQTISGGTTAHRYYASFSTEDEAFEQNVIANQRSALLVDLVDSYSGIRKAVELKKKYRDTDKVIAMRLDSGDLADQAIFALRLLHKNGMNDPAKDKVIIADVSSVEQLIDIENKIQEAGFDPKKFIVYGLGGLLVARDKTRDQLSAGYKLTHNEKLGATGKLSNDPGKEPIPGIPNVEIRDNQRVVVQEYEEKLGERLLNTVYENGEFYFQGNDIEAIDIARKQLTKTMGYVGLSTIESEETKLLHEEVRERLFLNKM